MGQVPEISYLMVGNGRLAGHMRHYFTLEKIPHRHWHRKSDTPLAEVLTTASHVLVLISDDAIEAFIRRHTHDPAQTWIHCSGCLDTDLAVGVHPLMTFAPGHYDLKTYRKIPFVCDRQGPAFEALFPALCNPSYTIDRKQKALYHALCVMGGNFSTLLWKKVADTFSTKLELPPAVLHPYMDQIMENIKSSDTPLTGPLARRDMGTIRKNLSSLESDAPFQGVYRAFMATVGIESEYRQLDTSAAAGGSDRERNAK